jgi:ATP-dependent DNA helicase RecQ
MTGNISLGVFAPRCLSIDLEVGRENGRIHQFAGVRGDSGEVVAFAKGDLNAALARLDALAEGAAFLLGHNLIAFDLPHLQAAAPGLSLLDLPAVDTLRLNPLAFPRHPYHHLVKHYLDGQLKRERRNDPELDARLTLEVFRDQRAAFLVLKESNPDLLTAWHWLATVEEGRSGLNAIFTTVRGQARPGEAAALAAIGRLLEKVACMTHARWVMLEVQGETMGNPRHDIPPCSLTPVPSPGGRGGQNAWPLAYALAWLSVAGGNSVMPPWVRHQFPAAGRLVKLLRDTPCGDPACSWCVERHDAVKELRRWFRLPGFRSSSDGRPLQQGIVEAAMRGEHVLGILPTGTGKSLCYQVPALSRYDKTGALTVVISPLVALMADQVAGMEARGISAAVAVNGLLSLPERADALDRVRLGDAGILIISPEQLRGVSVRRALAQREIGAWVLDEAHCLSKWGHDFRPDYRYVGRFIKESAGVDAVPPILCLTATAKPDVVADILVYFQDKVGVALTVFDGGSGRDNLAFDVIPTTPAEKPAHIHQVLQDALPADTPGGAIIYASTRKHAEDYAKDLCLMGMAAEHFHAGLSPERKKDVQKRFVDGELRVITATNAFGMGIDKPDVRLVVHADIPGSLENYLQEAGRAGRDRDQARCVLLYTPQDVERQFGLSARSRLSRREIQAVLKAVRQLDRKKHLSGEVVATPGEILAEEEEGIFERDSTTEDTRVKTALSWLEEASLLSREENRVSIFPSSLRVASLEEARQRLDRAKFPEDYRRKLLNIVDALLAANADEGISTDELMGVAGLTPEKTRHALHDLEALGIASNDTALTAFVHRGVERSSEKRLAEAAALEQDLIAHLREAAPDLAPGGESVLHLRHATQRLKDDGHKKVLPEQVWRLVKGLAGDGRGEEGNGSLDARKLDPETARIKLLRSWNKLEQIAHLRREAAGCLLRHLLACLPEGQRGGDLLAETSLGQLLRALNADLALQTTMKDPARLLDRALLWLHEQEIIRLNKGLAVFRPAMTLRLEQGKRGFMNADFKPLQLHYDEQVFQVHVMAEYAARGLEAVAEAVNLALDYFTQARQDFIRRWLPNREAELARQTTPASWREIVENLKNPAQQRIVADDREDTNVLVLAGPGSGKTRVLVHRIAYLVRARRENPRGILALAYNRHAAVEIRRRLRDLLGDDARGITVLTCHALAMRLAGVSFAERSGRDEFDFQQVLRDAIALLKGDGLPPDEADEQRDRLLVGYRWILVDEYQDIDADQYELISALAGRTRADADGKLTLFAVGDDDQNIYGFAGASVEFIRRFEQDYQARPAYLIENYRSTGHIIAAANALIVPARERMKAEHPIQVDRARRKSAPGGDWETRDPVARGRAQILTAGEDRYAQARLVMAELRRLASLDPAWDWKRVAVIAREWDDLAPLHAYCEAHDIPVARADEAMPPFWRLRETRAFVAWLRATPSPSSGESAQRLLGADYESWLDAQPHGPWWDLLREAITEYRLETGGADLPAGHLVEWLAEWGREVRRRQNGLLLLSAHRAKGLEFDHVVVLDGNWSRRDSHEDADAARRLYYVAMTRARLSLTLARLNRPQPLLDPLPDLSCLLRRPTCALPEPGADLARRYRRVYQRLSLADVDIGYAGRESPKAAIHKVIAALRPGDALTVYLDSKAICDARGRQVGKLAKNYRPPSGMRHVSAQVVAIVARERAQTGAEHQDRLKCDAWEVMIPELVFEPG